MLLPFAPLPLPSLWMSQMNEPSGSGLGACFEILQIIKLDHIDVGCYF